MQSLWSFLLYLCGLLVDAFSPCETPLKLHANELDRDQYLGRWFFIAAASSSLSSLENFTTTDSSVFSMTQSDTPERLQLRASIRLKTGQCVPRSWIYLLQELSGDLTTEGRPHMWTELFSTKCPDFIMVKETDQGYERVLLYSRTLHPDEKCIAAFKNQASCLYMDDFLLIPRTQARKEYDEKEQLCQQEGCEVVSSPTLACTRGDTRVIRWHPQQQSGSGVHSAQVPVNCKNLEPDTLSMRSTVSGIARPLKFTCLGELKKPLS